MKKISLALSLILVVSLISAFSTDDISRKSMAQEDIKGVKILEEKPNLSLLASRATVSKIIEQKGNVNTSSLNVRSLGSMQGKIITSIKKGVEVYVFNQENGWYYVEYAANKRGWVSASYIDLKSPTAPTTPTTPTPPTTPTMPDLTKIEKKGNVNVNGLNVRSLGSMEGKIVSVINKGTEVHVFGSKGKWYYVEYAANKQGWVYASYVDLKAATTPTIPDLTEIEKKGNVNVNGLNVRSLGSMEGKIVSVINKGTEVHVFGSKGKWYYVEYAANKQGWVYASYVDLKSASGPIDNLSNKSYSWYFVRNSNHQQPGFDKLYKDLLDKYNGVTIGNKDKKDIFLTFDNGYENGYTVKILDILKAQNIKVSFFVQGSYIDANPEIVKRMAKDGHIVLNHTNNHPELPTVSYEVLKQEIESTAKKYKNVTGGDMPKFLRPPSGVFSERTLAYTQQLGYRTVFWSMAYRDWVTTDQPGKDASYKHVTDNVHNGAVILLHSVSKSNTEALEDIIKELKRQGYNFKLLTQFP